MDPRLILHHFPHPPTWDYSSTSFERPPLGAWGGLSKEVVSDEGGSYYGTYHICDQQSRSYKKVVFHESNLSKGALLYLVLYPGPPKWRSEVVCSLVPRSTSGFNFIPRRE